MRQARLLLVGFRDDGQNFLEGAWQLFQLAGGEHHGHARCSRTPALSQLQWYGLQEARIIMPRAPLRGIGLDLVAQSELLGRRTSMQGMQGCVWPCPR